MTKPTELDYYFDTSVSNVANPTIGVAATPFDIAFEQGLYDQDLTKPEGYETPEIKANNGFLYKPEGRMWMTAFPNGAVEKARNAYSSSEIAGMAAGVEQGFEAGVVALYQKCPHLGCRVPNCVSSQWFECPCHGSQYNQVGEKRGGPAPRGMDRFAVTVNDGVLTVNTGAIIQGPPIGTNTTGQEAEGPNCIGQSDH